MAPLPPIFRDLGQYVTKTTKLQEIKAFVQSLIVLFCWYNIFMLQAGKYKD